MAFPTSPSNGQKYKDYIYESGLWEKIGKIIDSGEVAQGRWHKTNDGEIFIQLSDNHGISTSTSYQTHILDLPIDPFPLHSTESQAIEAGDLTISYQVLNGSIADGTKNMVVKDMSKTNITLAWTGATTGANRNYGFMIEIRGRWK